MWETRRKPTRPNDYMSTRVVKNGVNHITNDYTSEGFVGPLLEDHATFELYLQPCFMLCLSVYTNVYAKNNE